MSADLSAADVAAYRDRAGDLVASVAAYRAAATSMNSAAECSLALSHYTARARTDVDAMMGPLADRMDDHMRGMRSGDGDMRCGMNLVSAELDRHRSVACSSSNMEQNRAEALRHCDAIGAAADHLQMRGAELGGMMGSGGMGMGGMMDSTQPDAGWMMADGGMMPYGHRMLGCGLDGRTP